MQMLFPPIARRLTPGRLRVAASLAVILTAAPAAAQPPAAPPPQPALSWSGATARVQGVTPGGTVIWFAAIRDVAEYTVAQTTVAQAGVADATGTASLALASPISPYSIWVAVDYKTGAYVTGSPSPVFPLQQTVLHPAALSVGNAETPDYLLDGADRIQVLLVRPGQGAWTKALGRGGIDDESSPADGKLKFRLHNMDPVIGGGGPAPDKVGADDLLFLVHPATMDLSTLTVAAKP
jgi:hypothetical protein